MTRYGIGHLQKKEQVLWLLALDSDNANRILRTFYLFSLSRLYKWKFFFLLKLFVFDNFNFEKIIFSLIGRKHNPFRQVQLFSLPTIKRLLLNIYPKSIFNLRAIIIWQHWSFGTQPYTTEDTFRFIFRQLTNSHPKHFDCNKYAHFS